jgi:hypothetical protein
VQDAELTANPAGLLARPAGLFLAGAAAVAAHFEEGNLADEIRAARRSRGADAPIGRRPAALMGNDIRK